jgi:GNAT superfamily N-acetyltransferase
VYQRGEDVCGGFALMSIDPDYPGIFDGRWLNERPYVVIHRFVVSPKVHRQGIGQKMLAWIEDYARKINIRDIRLDTHEKNVPMIGLLQKLGYRRCGKVLLQRTLLREAYHKALEDAL